MRADNLRKEAVRHKYDMAAVTYSTRYADPNAVARRQADLVAGWGRPLGRGASILEVGCADGFVTEVLARAGYRVTAMDLSPAMVAVAKRRLQASAVTAEVIEGDVEALPLSTRYDAGCAILRTFFHYVQDAPAALERLSQICRKVLVDVNPRTFGIGHAVKVVREAGFDSVAWRPFFVPQRLRLPSFVMRGLTWGERIPGIRSVPVRWKFNVVVKGEWHS